MQSDRRNERQVGEYRSCRGDVCPIAAGRALSRVSQLSLETSHAPTLAVYYKCSCTSAVSPVYTALPQEALFACVKLAKLDRARCGGSVSCSNLHKRTILRLRLKCNIRHASRGSGSIPYHTASRNPHHFATSCVRSTAVNNLGIKVPASAMAALRSGEPIEGQRTNARGQKLFTVTYCASGQQRAVLFHHHGYGEHVGRMRHCKS